MDENEFWTPDKEEILAKFSTTTSWNIQATPGQDDYDYFANLRGKLHI